MPTRTGTDLTKKLAEMILGRAEEVLPQLCERIEDTRGEVPQKLTISLAFKPPKDEDSMARIECAAKLNASTAAATVMAQVEVGEDGAQLGLFG
jgi:16S rRNA C1402 (ribose-2'-O) methylase RsmI